MLFYILLLNYLWLFGDGFHVPIDKKKNMFKKQRRRIGNDANRDGSSYNGQFKYLAIIKNETSMVCLGVMHSPSTAITCSDCVSKNFDRYKIVVGATTFPVQNHSQTKDIVGYKISEVGLVLVRFEPKIKEDNYSGWMTMGMHSYPFSERYPRHKCTSVGFSSTTKLKKIFMIYNNTCPNPHLVCYDQGIGPGFCPGDLGAPLICGDSVEGVLVKFDGCNSDDTQIHFHLIQAKEIVSFLPHILSKAIQTFTHLKPIILMTYVNYITKYTF